ncbi:hypothetical protein LGZ99_11520 [Photorhabdus temperata]|uniref:3-hydroxymyristoyl/3-hydroxydecanoyl-(Acyl carrier protein) dehydratase n=1 Tax=Photorhabdus temperata subsp. temperata Meg1 TaxID=1393735 RepID=A0A081RWJ1_PHOTE|nr:hypothetical protein [Photorhabdus temperata]KER03044.1 3-hydroxymyristoyl/3-hydroxydecanoyl-(acyl carrier protein) dehydratase [Photorhabdus temperata subsp. temperata Meg1]MCT8347822.1 hypothetical protein [Photorhabdus temperata]
MNRKNSHGAIVETISSESFSILFPHSCSFFKGHFPNNPIVPGVLLLDTIYDNLVKIGVLDINGIDNARFYNTVTPNEKITVKLNNLSNKVVCTAKNEKGKVLKASFMKRL